MLMMNRLVVLACISLTVFSAPVSAIAKTTMTDNDLYFDPALFPGSHISEEAFGRLSKADAVAPGSYKVDIYLNGNFIARKDIRFAVYDNDNAEPCFDMKTLHSAGIKLSADRIKAAGEAQTCLRLQEVVKEAQSKFDQAHLRLDLTLPQNALVTRPRGYVAPEDLDYGASIGFVNYLANYYHVSWSGSGNSHQDSAWLSLNSGVNLGLWQFRQQSNVNWSREQGSQWQRIRSYVQRPLPEMGSQFSAGELITTGQFFSGMSFNGITLSTDDRMLPDSVRGYAPVVRGVASATSKVTISQNGQQIYQTTVPPGAFEISDLYPTSYSGDLDVEVASADGTLRRFSVPFSAVPESIRPGLSRFNFNVGRSKESGERSPFADITWQHGLSNSITMNSGLRLADRYQSLIAGGVYGSMLGAFGADITWSNATLPGSGAISGWMSHLSYSKTIQATRTTVSLAGYRYSSSGYRDLGDVLAQRQAASGLQHSEMRRDQQQSRFDISLSQSMQQYGNLFLSASLQRYRNSTKENKQLQFGYSNGLRNGVSYTISAGRQYLDNRTDARRAETVTSLSLSMPLGRADSRLASLNSNWTRSSDGGDQYQTTVAGTLDQAQTLNYNLGVQHSQRNQQTTINAGLQQRRPNASLSLNASRGSQYWQTSAAAQGAVAIHQGGVTFGPYLGDTFALIEAKGATGASVFNGMQATIDGNGYALVPSLLPYRYSMIALNPQGMAEDVDLTENQRRVAPVAGAAVKIKFRTRAGKALIITALRQDNQPVPLGADVYDEAQTIAGMVAQNGQLYLRTDQHKGRLLIKWGAGADEQCQLDYRISAAEAAMPLIKKTANCRPRIHSSGQSREKHSSL